jgi:hypothetical protein
MRRFNTIAAGVALARVATTLRRCCSSQQRRKATSGSSLAATAGRATLLCSDGRGPAPNYFIYLFIYLFLLDSVKERTRVRQREKRQGFETCFPALLVSLNVTRKLPPTATVATTCAPSGSNNITPVVTTQELQKCKKFVAFNMK